MAFANMKAFTCQRFVGYAFAIIGSTLFVLIASLWLSVSGFAPYGKSVKSFFGNEMSLAEDVNKLVPEFTRHTRTFWNNSEFGPHSWRHEMSSAQQQELLQRWGSLMPGKASSTDLLKVEKEAEYCVPQAENMGFVPVQHHERYDLPPPLRWDNDGPHPDYFSYSMSVFHQIHCLDGILRAFLYDSNGKHDSSVKLDTPHNHVFDDIHIFHCFDYLRQALMCCGDTALEGADPYEIAEGKDFFSFGTYGIGTTHICKDYSKIVEHADSFQPPGS